MTSREIGRFCKAVAAVPQDGGFVILLDGKKVKTPAGVALMVPTQALAEAIAAEWLAQEGKTLPHAMALTKLANTAIDRIGKERATILAALTGFGVHDLLCYRSEDAQLALRESVGWDPLLAWAQDRYGAPFKVTTGIIAAPQQVDVLSEALAACDDFLLAGLAPVIAITGSLILGLALAENRIDAVGAFVLSRIDEAYQAEKWGMDAEAQARAGALERELASAGAFIALART